MALRNIDIGAGASAFLEPERKKGIVIDIPILLITLSIAGLGFIVLYSAAGENSSVVLRQVLRFGVALVVFGILAQVSPRLLRIWAPWIFSMALIFLLMVMFRGCLLYTSPSPRD